MSDNVPDPNLDWLRQLFSWKGRISRASWWGFQFISLVLEILVWAIMGGFADNSVSAIIGLIIFISYHLVIIYIGVGMNVKRLHDTGKSGWELLWILIPIFGFFFILITCGFVRGNLHENQYGPEPEKFSEN